MQGFSVRPKIVNKPQLICRVELNLSQIHLESEASMSFPLTEAFSDVLVLWHWQHRCSLPHCLLQGRLAIASCLLTSRFLILSPQTGSPLIIVTCQAEASVARLNASRPQHSLDSRIDCEAAISIICHLNDDFFFFFLLLFFRSRLTCM